MMFQVWLLITIQKDLEVFKERELLQSSNLDMPFSLRFYNECKGVEVLEKDSKLMEALWEYHLKK